MRWSPWLWLWLWLGMLPLALAVSVHGDDAPVVRRDVSYGKDGGARTRLDVYGLAVGADRPIIVWIHGGGWSRGDKGRASSKAKAFNAHDDVFVSVDYRLHPQATYREQAGDVASAVLWVRDHAREFGGDPGRIVLMGHSAGAHLAALVAADGRYLKAVGLSPGDLSAVVLLDGACYDVPRQVRQAVLPAMKAMYLKVFTSNEATQKDASPIAHVARNAGLPPFLILHVARRADSKLQSNALAAAIREAGGEAKVVPAEGKTHATINQDLGKPDDPPTREVFEFLRARVEPKDARRPRPPAVPHPDAPPERPERRPS